MKTYEIYEFGDSGYAKLFHHQSWRVAMLNYIEELEIDHINYVEAHLLTDEAFVLLSGECVMVFAHLANQKITSFESIKLEPHKVYKVPNHTYHTHILSKNSKLLVIEEENTCALNSPRIYLSEIEKQMLRKTYLGAIHGV
jgi:hypothetical protein